jgi:iron complex outermembrane receptor protein
MGAGRGQLRWLPGDDWEVTAGASLDVFRNGRLVQVPITQQDPFVINQDLAGHENTDANNQFLRINRDTKWFKLTSNMTRRDFAFDYLTDGDGGPMSLMAGFHRQGSTQYTEELRIDSLRGADWRFAGGAFVATKTSHLTSGFTNLTSNYTDQKVADLGYQDFALFAEVGRHLYKSLEATAGLRFDLDARSIDRSHQTMAMPPDMHLNDTFSGVQPKAGLDYAVETGAGTIVPFASVTRGYKSGGYSYQADNPDVARFAPARSWQYQMGAKSAWWDGRVRADAAVFDNEVNDYQVYRGVDPFNVTLVDAQHVRTRGFELETSAEPAKNLRLGAAFGLTDASFTEFVDPNGKKLTDNKVNLVPKNQLSANAQYMFDFGLFGRAELTRVGGYYYDDANTGKTSPYTLENLRLGYKHPSFETYLFANNLSDQRYFPLAFPTMSGTFSGVVGNPRTFGIGATGIW